MNQRINWNWRRLSRVARRLPALVYLSQRIYRITQPKVSCGAVGVIFNAEGLILLVEHALHPKTPWGLPGGWMGRNETPDETVQRELLEETGLHIQVIKPLLVARTRLIPHHLDFAYLCYVIGRGEPIRLSDELLDYRWLDAKQTDTLPPLSKFHFAAVRAALAEWPIVSAAVS